MPLSQQLRVLRRTGLGICALALAACPSSTHVGGYACYPEGTEPAGAEFCLWVELEGGAGKAYVERSRKTVRLSILDAKKQVVLEREYGVEAGDLGWSSAWPSLSDLQIVFFDWGPPTSTEAVGGNRRITRQVFALAFTHDTETGTFVEAAAPSQVMKGELEYDALENRRHIFELSYADSPESEMRILDTVRELAESRELRSVNPQAGVIGHLAEYSATDFLLRLQRHTSLGQLAVVVEDHGDRELSAFVVGSLRDIPGLVGTRRFVSINFRLASEDLETIVGAVESVARRYGLARTNRSEMFEMASFEADGLRLALSHFEEAGRVKISMEDFGSHPAFEELEETLRSEFEP